MSAPHAEPTPLPPPRGSGALVWRVVRGVLALVGAAVLTLTALGALGIYALFGRSPEHDAEQHVAAFTEETIDLPHVRTVDGVRLGVADMLQPVRDAFVRVVLDDGATLATLRRTADRLRPWTTGSETDDRVHPELDLDGYSMTVSPSAAVTDSRIRLLVAAQEDAALRGARFVVAQPGGGAGGRPANGPTAAERHRRPAGFGLVHQPRRGSAALGAGRGPTRHT